MSQAAYPVALDLTNAIAAGGAVDVTSAGFGLLNMNAFLSAAIAKWHSITGWQPFLSDGANYTRNYDPPGPRASRVDILRLRGGGRILFLDGGLLTCSALTISEYSYEQGIQFWLRPDNAAQRGRPTTRIEFIVPVYGTPQSIAVTGTWGFSATVPDDVWQGILDYARALAAPQLVEMITQGVIKIDTTQFAGTSDGSTVIGSWAIGAEDRLEAMAENYLRSIVV